jgi:hypothetical protein
MVMVLLPLKLQAQLNVVGLRLRRLLRGWEIDESRIHESSLKGVDTSSAIAGPGACGRPSSDSQSASTSLYHCMPTERD